jgi:23S rRNA (guanosine2251-2'-O)-methyltransferase
MLIYGVHPVIEALRAGRARELIVAARHDARIAEIVKNASVAGVPVRRVDGSELVRMARGGAHQGVAASLHEARAAGLDDLVAAPDRVPLIVVLDGIEDPHNVGAILRSADAAGASGVIRQSRRAASLEGAAAKASAGAISHVKIVDVVNIARAIEELKVAGVWTVGLAGDAAKRYDEVDLTLPTALVVGAEGAGLRRLVRARCDIVASIPMLGHVESLNVSVATGIVLFEALRQRRKAPGRRAGDDQPARAPGGVTPGDPTGRSPRRG